ncbi:MAG: RNA polymerase sigma factor [Planctomycetota bacterium]
MVAARKGHHRSAERLWALEGPGLLAFARLTVGEEADDAVQVALLSALSRPVRELRSLRDPRAWLYTLVRRAALNIVRGDSRRVRRERAVARGDLAVPASSFGDAELAGALRSIDHDLAEAVLLRTIGGLGFAQIGAVTGVDAGTAGRRYRRGLECLRETLEGVASRDASMEGSNA